MKLSFAVLALALSLPLFAEAKSKAPPSVKDCAFGDSTADLDEMFEVASSKSKIWYKGEHISLHKAQRLNGLTDSEKQMILMSQNYSKAGGESEQELLESFAGADGYITYFSHNTNGRDFAIVASFPGDNEFGVILEVKANRSQSEYSILGVAAVIGDGDLESCQVAK